jgi:SEC-C motif domain protein
MKKCPCHSNLSYGTCCLPFHQGKSAPDAKTLMRSRYSAYALNLTQYIIDTTHPQNPSYEHNQSKWKKELANFSRYTRFTSLEILDFTETKNEAFVTFKAGLEQMGSDASFIEKSRFLNENGKWLYSDCLSKIDL